jgi:hypothetical protein
VPDGSTDAGHQAATPEQQIALEVTANRMDGWLLSTLGVDFRSEAGGGAGGGEGGFVFADLAELDTVIEAWREELRSIEADRARIEHTRAVVDRPAGDAMSVHQAQATRQSLTALAAHNREMAAYAQSYLEKLVASRRQMSADDQAAEASMRNVHPG